QLPASNNKAPLNSHLLIIQATLVEQEITQPVAFTARLQVERQHAHAEAVEAAFNAKVLVQHQVHPRQITFGALRTGQRQQHQQQRMVAVITQRELQVEATLAALEQTRQLIVGAGQFEGKKAGRQFVLLDIHQRTLELQRELLRIGVGQ